MIKFLRENIPVILGGVTLVGAIFSGVQQLTLVVDNLNSVDDRIYNLEEQFYQLEQSTMVSNDIAILYEKIYQLESANYENDYLAERVLLLEENYSDLQQKMYDLEYLENPYHHEYLEGQSDLEYLEYLEDQ